jgi:hypothetical protein
MKKSVLALSIAAAVGGLGFAGGAMAQTVMSAEAGIGQVLVVPYYTAQTEHATLINIVNTDTMNGKAVKVRFRGAANSDDVYDFQVFLSPGDVWAASVSQDSASGLAMLTTSDTSCTKPASVNGTFVTSRLKASWSAEKKAENTREGYVEILNMADVAPGNELYTAIKHVKGAKPPCSGTAWTALDAPAIVDLKTNLSAPTSGLMGGWMIVNVNNASSWGSTTPAFVAMQTGAAVAGNVVYFPQILGDVAVPGMYTADPLFVQSKIKAQYYDLPDLSTPYTAGAATADAQARQYTRALETTSINNEYLTDALINASTDWVVSMPSRRYAVAVDYANNVALYNTALENFFAPSNTALVNDQVCVKNVLPTAYDREEQYTSNPTEVVISPSPLPVAAVFCGEASILTINNPDAASSGVLNGTVAVNDIDANGWSNGWISLATPGATPGYGLPVLGGSFVRAAAGMSTFGVNWDHRYVRAVR